jgi:pimeloyl-ACP methyl ester carboxylesterase
MWRRIANISRFARAGAAIAHQGNPYAMYAIAHWLRRIGIGVLVVLAAATLAGSAYEMWARHRAAAEFPAPGILVDIGGRRIHLDCRGTGAPIVVFESGLDLYGSLSWSAVQDSVARTTRACSYDRAGIMWSDRSGGARNGAAIASDLHKALQAAGERGPYVMVGHSLGGPYVMTFAKQFGDDVAGVVFVDASHPDQQRRMKEAVGRAIEESMATAQLGAALAWTGLPRVVAQSSGHPKALSRANAAMSARLPLSLRALLDEQAAIDETFAEAGTLRSLGDRPLVVLTAAAPVAASDLATVGLTSEQGQQLQAVWFDLHREETSWSSRGREVRLEDAHHYIQFERPDAVIDAIREVIESVRASTALKE